MKLIFAIILILLVPLSSHSLCVKTEKAFLRSGPGTKYKKTWTVGKYMPLKEIGKKGNWFMVKDLDNKKHWVHKKLVSANLSCVVVSTRYTKLRKGPGRNYPLADIRNVDKYTPFKKIGREDSWVFLEDDLGHQYWTYDKHIWQPLHYVNVSY